MPITKSAQKALRKDLKRQTHNRWYKLRVKSLMKEVRVLATSGKKTEAAALMPKLYKALDKAAKENVIKKNTASRRKSRLTKLLGKS